MAVVAIIVGQALLFGALGLVLLGAVLWLAFHLFVLAYEEPTLQGTFGAEYEVYRANVPRWVPRLTPWRGPYESNPNPRNSCHPHRHGCRIGARAARSRSQPRTTGRERYRSCLVLFAPQADGTPERDRTKSEAGGVHRWGPVCVLSS